jgi:hypothetical protein
MGPDMAAGSIQIHIDRVALVHFTTPFLSSPQQVVRPFFTPVSFLALSLSNRAPSLSSRLSIVCARARS